MSGKVASLRDVAEAAGVSTFTASQALRGKAGVRVTTRERVVAVAAELGYVANAAAALMAKQRGAVSRNGLAIGCLAEAKWGHELFLKQCTEMGLQGHVFRPSEFSSPEGASRMLWSRGISGLLVSPDRMPWPEDVRRRFEWSRFSVVKLSRALPDISCHLVRHSAFDYMALTLRKVVERGYRRMAVLLMQSDSREDDDARYGALLNFKERKLPPGVSMEWREIVRMQPSHVDRPTADWLREFRPDVIVGYHWSMIYGLNERGWTFPADAGFAAVLVEDETVPNMATVSGCVVQTAEMNRRALELLQELIGRSERGFPVRLMEHVLEPVWIEGETLPRR